jgi:hypothetical protein
MQMKNIKIFNMNNFKVFIKKKVSHDLKRGSIHTRQEKCDLLKQVTAS